MFETSGCVGVAWPPPVPAWLEEELSQVPGGDAARFAALAADLEEAWAHPGPDPGMDARVGADADPRATPGPDAPGPATAGPIMR